MTATVDLHPDDMPKMARDYQDQWEAGHPAAGPASRFRWRYEAAYPIARIQDRTPEEWCEWMSAEVEMWADEGDPERFADEIENPTREPVVAVEIGGVGFLWDGNHRIGGSVLRGRKSVPAVVGTLTD